MQNARLEPGVFTIHCRQLVVANGSRGTLARALASPRRAHMNYRPTSWRSQQFMRARRQPGASVPWWWFECSAAVALAGLLPAACVPRIETSRRGEGADRRMRGRLGLMSALTPALSHSQAVPESPGPSWEREKKCTATIQRTHPTSTRPHPCVAAGDAIGPRDGPAQSCEFQVGWGSGCAGAGGAGIRTWISSPTNCTS